MLEAGLARVYSFEDNRTRRDAGGRAARPPGAASGASVLRHPRSADAGPAGQLQRRRRGAGRRRSAPPRLLIRPDWRDDFTMVSRPTMSAPFAPPASNRWTCRPAGAGAGWIYRRNGPMIDATHPEQIELLEARDDPTDLDAHLRRLRRRLALLTALAGCCGDPATAAAVSLLAAGASIGRQEFPGWWSSSAASTGPGRPGLSSASAASGAGPARRAAVQLHGAGQRPAERLRLARRLCPVTRGLLALMNDEAELAGVMATRSRTSPPGTAPSATARPRWRSSPPAFSARPPAATSWRRPSAPAPSSTCWAMAATRSEADS